MSVQTPEELQANLDEYRGQLEQVTFSLLGFSVQTEYGETTFVFLQVDELLTLDPGNAEYQDLHTSLLEVLYSCKHCHAIVKDPASDARTHRHNVLLGYPTHRRSPQGCSAATRASCSCTKAKM